MSYYNIPNYNRLQKKIHYLKLNFDFDIEKFNSKRNEIKEVINLINQNLIIALMVVITLKT